jgi:hypothetical protein
VAELVVVRQSCRRTPGLERGIPRTDAAATTDRATLPVLWTGGFRLVQPARDGALRLNQAERRGSRTHPPTGCAGWPILKITRKWRYAGTLVLVRQCVRQLTESCVCVGRPNAITPAARGGSRVAPSDDATTQARLAAPAGRRFCIRAGFATDQRCGASGLDRRGRGCVVGVGAVGGREQEVRVDDEQASPAHRRVARVQWRSLSLLPRRPRRGESRPPVARVAPASRVLEGAPRVESSCQQPPVAHSCCVAPEPRFPDDGLARRRNRR